MKVSLKKVFSLVDGRLSTEMTDVYEMLSYIFDGQVYTHEMLSRMKELDRILPDWYLNAIHIIDGIKHNNKTNDFDVLMEIIAEEYSDCEIELKKI